MKLPAMMALSHMDFMGKPHTTCTNCMSYLVDEGHTCGWPGIGSFWLPWKVNKVASGHCFEQVGCVSSRGCHVCL